MGDVELTTLLQSLHSLVQDTRDRVLKVEGALDMLSSFKSDLSDRVKRLEDAADARLSVVEAEVQLLKDRDGAADAVAAYQREARRDRRWLIGIGFTSLSTAVAVAGLLIARVG